MQEIIAAERVFAELKQAIVGAMDVSEGQIEPDSVLTRDLGAESLDFLDINYRLEQAFGLKMARYSILVHAEELFGEGSVLDAHARLTEEAVIILRRRFGERTPQLKAGMDMGEVMALVTVQSMVDAVVDLLRSLPEACPHCGHAAWQTPDGCRVVCGSCGEIAVYRNGDDLMKEWLLQVQQEEGLFP
jgi:acyl carrier protein